MRQFQKHDLNQNQPIDLNQDDQSASLPKKPCNNLDEPNKENCSNLNQDG